MMAAMALAVASRKRVRLVLRAAEGAGLAGVPVTERRFRSGWDVRSLCSAASKAIASSLLPNQALQALQALRSLAPRRPSLCISFPFFCPPAYPPTMSGHHCLRRLPAAVRSVRALRPSPRCMPATRSYSAVTRASSSGLLGQASRYCPSLALSPSNAFA